MKGSIRNIIYAGLATTALLSGCARTRNYSTESSSYAEENHPEVIYVADYTLRDNETSRTLKKSPLEGIGNEIPSTIFITSF